MKSTERSRSIARTRSAVKKMPPFRTQRTTRSSPARSAAICAPISRTRDSICSRLINVREDICAKILCEWLSRTGGSMSVAEIGQLHGRYVRLSDEFKAIWTYNQFAAGVYKSFLQAPVPYRVDFQKLYEAIRASSDTIQSSSPQNAVPILERCERELHAITRLLVGADDAVKPSVLRRFLEKLKQQDEKIIFNLIKFYLYAGAIEGDQRDKIDFLFTKIGEDFVEARGEYWSKDSLELRKQFQSLLAIHPLPEVDQKEIVILIRSIRENKEEIQQVDSF